MSTPRVPESLSLFSGYIVNADDRLQATNTVTTNPYWTDFGLTTIQQAAITGFRTNWGTNFASQITLPNVAPDVKQNAHTFRNSVANYFKDEKILDKIVASNMANATDEMIFHVKLLKSDPTFHTVPIPDACFAFITQGGLGQYDVFVRTTADSSRSSIPVAHGANCVQYAFRVFDTQQPVAFTPFTPDNNWIVTPSSHAHFVLDIGTQYVGKWAVMYFRWYNDKHPAIAGGWSAMYQKVIG